ncbi:hypothetical protein BV898_12926 [Hypsibius exemplaris]|uniref:Uncharacterized protein n=1 Tax=Hypsibius exemplaris TaxID=2072580 RepID=A0A1W0WC98_HYPEX|nr:hypothetical protein BV898_12926 [Hypsibius exemplaris]
MGKVRKLRQKYHNLTSHQQPKEDRERLLLKSEFSSSPGMAGGLSGPSEPSQSLIDELFTPDTLRAAPKITSQLLKQQFAEFEERNTIATTLSAKSSTYAQMKKKTKQDLRHQLWQKSKFGSVRLGSARLGSARHSLARLDSTRLNSTQFSSIRLSSARLDSVRLDLTQLTSARLSSTRLSLIRLGSARLGSTRLEVEGVQTAKLEAKAQAKREKKAVIGDTQPMLSALSDMSSFLKDVTTQREKKISDGVAKYKPLKKRKARAEEQSQNIATMTAVMNDPDFRADPFSAISTHLKLKFSAPTV